MDDSHSSDIFFEDVANSSYNGSLVNMDDSAYESLLGNTKASLSRSIAEDTSLLASHLSTILEDCKLCISQSLELVTKISIECDTQQYKLYHYMEEAVTMLQMLSNFIKNVVEAMTMSCCTLKTFPTTTGLILIEVFTHCKNSEMVYGTHLKSVENQLKDLFRSCHELQLTYLLILEKHFIFDLAEKDQLDIFIEALNINLKIGELVQSLDVKTMAEQWKAYTMICEKYSTFLNDQNIFNGCTKLLCDMVRNNIRTTIEVDQEEKVIIRSMKVTNFTIKILLKIFNIFKHAAAKDYVFIVDWLVYVFLHNRAYLDAELGKSQQFIHIMSTNVTYPTDLLLRELVADEKFLNVVFTYTNKSKDYESVLGYILLITSLSETVSQTTGETHNLSKLKLINCLFKSLPDCYLWMNIGLKFQTDESDQNSLGLYEYLLVHATSLAVCMNAEEMSGLEKMMYEALLRNDSVVAMFAANLWRTIARLHNNRLLLLSQLTSLCHIYQKLENHKLFRTSPQEVHLKYLLNALFEIIPSEDKVKVFKQFNPEENSSNASLWCVLKIKNLPRDLQQTIRVELIDKWKEHLQKITAGVQHQDAIPDLIKLTNLVSTCSITSEDSLDKYLLKGWLMACPKTLRFLSNSLDSGTLWYFEYIKALALLTSTMEPVLREKSSCVVKILHVISEIIQFGCMEFNLLLIDLLCDLAKQPLHDENKHYAENNIIESLKSLVYSNNNILRNKLFVMIHQHQSKYLQKIMSSVVTEDYTLLQEWDSYLKGDIDYEKLKEQLGTAKEIQFVHKCIARNDATQQNSQYDEIQRTGSNNFDLADIDSLFDNESDSEPASKKTKLNCTETENTVARIESDTSLLCKTKENLTNDHKRRITTVLDKLKSLVT